MIYTVGAELFSYLDTYTLKLGINIPHVDLKKIVKLLYRHVATAIVNMHVISEICEFA